MKLAAFLLLTGLAFSQSAVTIPDLATAKWTHNARDNSDSILLREDEKTGATDLLVRYPAGHSIGPHRHAANERLILLEGKLKVKIGDTPEVTLSPGGLFIAPAQQTHQMTCETEGRCTFYLAWDGKLR